MKLTEAQRRNLIHVHDHGQPVPRSRSAYTCRQRRLTEWLWRLANGNIIGNSEVDQKSWYDQMQGAKVIGERLTPAGRAALEQGEEE